VRSERIALLVLSTLLVVVSGVLAWRLWQDSGLELRNLEAHPIAEALQGESEEGTQGAWPPVAGGADRALADAGARLDGGLDAGPADAAVDAGPPLPAPIEELGYRARQGSRDGLYYLEVVIGDADFDDPLPMIVMIHGRGGSAQIPGGPFLGLSHAVRVIVPQAPDRLGTGWQWLPVYVGQGLVDRLSATLFQTASRLAAMLRGLAAERPTVGRLIVSGFSQGGLLTLALAIHHDDLVGHAFPLASWLPPPIEPLYRRNDLVYPRIRSMHGTADTVIPLEPTRAMFARLAERGFDVDLVQFPNVQHVISEEENALFHEWLEAAVCRTLGDEVGAVVAELRALRLRGEELPDAGIPEDVAMFDADLDAGDAGPPPDAWAPDAWAPDAYVDDAYADDAFADDAAEPETPASPEGHVEPEAIAPREATE
jgi:phospholipase/carboxylesterase